jgi:hypothetical protein
MAQRPSSASAPTTRRRVDPERKRLGLAVLMVVFGSFAPWLDTAVGPILGGRGAGLWTFYASLLGLAGALVPSRTVAGVQAAIMAVVCTVLPVWQLVRAVSLLGTDGGWLPGPGLVLVFGGGVLAGVAALGLLRNRAPSQP